MKDDEENIELFDRFLQGKLSSEERDRFQSRLENNKDLQEEYNQYQDSVILLNSIGINQDVREIIDENKHKKNLWLPLGIAASIVLLIGLYLGLGIEKDSQQLFESNYKPYPNLFAIRTSNVGKIGKGMDYYTRGNYSQAIIELNSEISIDPSDTLLFYKAISHLSINQPDSSLSTFQKIPLTSNYKQQILWYSSLAYLLKDDLTASKILLKKIQPNNFRYRESKELLKELK